MITGFYWLCPETVNGLHPWVSRHALPYVLAACVHSCPASAPHRLLLVSVFPVIPWLRMFSAVQTGINVNSCCLICCSAPMPYLIGVHTSLMEVGFTTWALRPPSLSLYIHHCIFPIHPQDLYSDHFQPSMPWCWLSVLNVFKGQCVSTSCFRKWEGWLWMMWWF